MAGAQWAVRHARRTLGGRGGCCWLHISTHSWQTSVLCIEVLQSKHDVQKTCFGSHPLNVVRLHCFVIHLGHFHECVTKGLPTRRIQQVTFTEYRAKPPELNKTDLSLRLYVTAVMTVPTPTVCLQCSRLITVE